MARRRTVSVPSISDMMRREKTHSTPYEQEVLQASLNPSGGRGRAAEGFGEATRVASERRMTHEVAMAFQEAKEGDDSILLPYQPTPSINPPRPRTLAAGYDKDTSVMRVRFRDGQVYGYANVSPNEWRNFRRVKSPGRAINRTFNAKPYWHEHTLDQQH